MSMRINPVNVLFYFSISILVLIISSSFFNQADSTIISNNPASESRQPLTPDNKHGINQPTTNLVIENIEYAHYQSSFGPLPKSLKNTHIPLHFKLTEDGQLVVTRSIRSLIEYFLSANSQESIATITGRIRELMDSALQEPARSQAKEVLKQYIEYKHALIQIEQHLSDEQVLSGNQGDYQQVFQYRTQAREKYLSREVYDAFFKKDDSRDNYTAGILALKKDPSFTDEERTQQILLLEQSLPPEEQAIKTAQHRRESLQMDVMKARDTGANDADIFQMRAQVYDQETAERFAKSDQKQAKWNGRFAHYRQQRQQIMAGVGMTDEDKESQVHALQTELFNDNEQRRLSTLDRLADNRVH
ncbi:hypothetical protein A9R00_01335 [Oleispira antarctica]|uniref:Lipase chaperone n=1 Tax=Oleispira antarctica TaxID=188908 RepID=A0A1Y5HVM1_OLEAN|nr:hypothetical protein A9R00_01335 [Oleispira antarctica]